MSKIIGIFDVKGGSGKTTLAINLSAGLAIRGKKVLLIDNHPTWSTIRELIPEDVKVTYDIESVYKGIPLKKAIYQSTIQGVDIVPFLKKDLTCLKDLPTLRSKQFNESDTNPLKKALNLTTIEDYDYVVIDAFPLFDSIIGKLLQVTDRLIVPVNCYFAMENLKKANEIIMKFANVELEPYIDSIIMTKVTSNSVTSMRIREELEELFGDKVCKTVIPETIKFDEALLKNKSVHDYAPKSNASIQCMKLVDELLERWEG